MAIDNTKIAASLLLIAVALAACGPIRDEPAEEPGSSTISPADLTPDSVSGVREAPSEETGARSDSDQATGGDEMATVDNGSAGETDDAELSQSDPTLPTPSQSDLPLPTPEHPKYPDPEFEIPPPRD